MSTSIVTGKVRLSYANLLEAKPPQDGKGEPKYSTTILLPKSDTSTMNAINAAITEATQLGISKKWGGKQPAKIDIPIHDGNGIRPNNGEPFGEECRDCWVFTASSKQRPGLVDQRVQPIMDSTQVYSGMYAYVDINFYPYNSNGRNGIGIGLNNVQKVADGEAFSGQRSASEAFKPIESATAPMGFQPQTMIGQQQSYQAQPAFNPYQSQQPTQMWAPPQSGLM